MFASRSAFTAIASRLSFLALLLSFTILSLRHSTRTRIPSNKRAMNASSDLTSGIQRYAQHAMSTMGPPLAYARPLGPHLLVPAVLRSLPHGNIAYPQPALAPILPGQEPISCTKTLSGSNTASRGRSPTQERCEIAAPARQTVPVPRLGSHAGHAHFATGVEVSDIASQESDVQLTAKKPRLRDSGGLDECTSGTHSDDTKELCDSGVSSGTSGLIADSLTDSASLSLDPIEFSMGAASSPSPLTKLEIEEEFEARMRQALLIPSTGRTDFDAVPLRTRGKLVGVPRAGSKGHYEMLAKLIMWKFPARTCKIKDIEEKIVEIWPAYKELASWRSCLHTALYACKGFKPLGNGLWTLNCAEGHGKKKSKNNTVNPKEREDRAKNHTRPGHHKASKSSNNSRRGPSAAPRVSLLSHEGHGVGGGGSQQRGSRAKPDSPYRRCERTKMANSESHAQDDDSDSDGTSCTTGEGHSADLIDLSGRLWEAVSDLSHYISDPLDQPIYDFEADSADSLSVELSSCYDTIVTSHPERIDDICDSSHDIFCASVSREDGPPDGMFEKGELTSMSESIPLEIAIPDEATFMASIFKFDA
ncbi:hypothetical protein CONPUDRAFT_70629 [Coniophora puteana RWD-64-598 SS2]|uniref:Uncharacterized protein n=1 Tax=Coniophora puteana (strain RWD-64-598) TaxID=741705 RepID=A0A5M3MYB9_CONPW|nr:uncharacterized protein CONPUDRAFT_70629 [Coniophora puteana RWD-64-598 SS2]EIW83655.1 hypothetical protein CONPUDRAFT_70629 [Coniophora puteana RWD-64-598 SS2]